MAKLKYTFQQDILFKMLFIRYQNLLKALVSVLLGISIESIEQFSVTNPEIPPESLGDKFCRLDINMTVNGQQVDLEVQVDNKGDFPERSLYYWARSYSSALKKGMTYSQLPRTIVISIVDFKMFDCEDFHSEIAALEATRHTSFTDKFCMHFFELPKIPKTVCKDDKLNLWLSLFNAKTEEELKQIEELEVPEMKQAVQAYHSITVTPEFMEAQRLYDKARHDEASALFNAEKKRATEIALNMLSDGEPIEKIVRYTGLPRAEVEKLQQELSEN